LVLYVFIHAQNTFELFCLKSAKERRMMEFCQAKDYLTAGYWLHVTRDVRVNLQ